MITSDFMFWCGVTEFTVFVMLTYIIKQKKVIANKITEK